MDLAELDSRATRFMQGEVAQSPLLMNPPAVSEAEWAEACVRADALRTTLHDAAVEFLDGISRRQERGTERVLLSCQSGTQGVIQRATRRLSSARDNGEKGFRFPGAFGADIALAQRRYLKRRDELDAAARTPKPKPNRRAA